MPAVDFKIVDYIKKQIKLLTPDLDTSKLIQQVKKLSLHDYIVQGKRFQIKQPPVLTINDSTKVTDIIVKVGVSSQNMKEFLMSIINEALNNRDAMSGGASMSGISGQYGPP